jgi:hypothetical protein
MILEIFLVLRLLSWRHFAKKYLLHLQMHGYDIGIGMNMPLHGPPPPIAQLPNMESNSHHHPDSTDSYVTYLESDDSMQGSP